MKKVNYMMWPTLLMQINSVLVCIPDHERRITYATLCTLLRILLAPFIVIALVHHYWGVACCLFICAALTDMIDGFIARHFDQKTLIGACLDPVADKILLISCFGSLSFAETPLFVIPHWFFYVLCGKEIMQCVGAVLLFLVKKNIVIEATLLGKTTTLVHIFFIMWLFVCYFFNWMPLKTYTILLVMACALVVVTFIDYVRVGIKYYTTVGE